ncbi:hypothetical protein EI94DRAFT_684992 [Lactarius quietus]|nr:hypothetical protein EI94DRAFT_684992 [Lactarius quietus]
MSPPSLPVRSGSPSPVPRAVVTKPSLQPFAQPSHVSSPQLSPPTSYLVQTLRSYKRNHSQLGATSSALLVALVRLIRCSKYRTSSHPRYRVSRSTFYLRRAAHVSLDESHIPSAHGLDDSHADRRFSIPPRLQLSNRLLDCSLLYAFASMAASQPRFGCIMHGRTVVCPSRGGIARPQSALWLSTPTVFFCPLDQLLFITNIQHTM